MEEFTVFPDGSYGMCFVVVYKDEPGKQRRYLEEGTAIGTTRWCLKVWDAIWWPSVAYPELCRIAELKTRKSVIRSALTGSDPVTYGVSTCIFDRCKPMEA